VFGFIIAMVLLSFYASSEIESPLTVTQTLAYVWLGQALLALLPWNVDPVAHNAIRTGEVVQELLRPVDVYRLWFTRVLAWRLVRVGLRCGPMVLLAMWLFPRIGIGQFAMPGPASAEALGLFAVALTLSVLLSGVITVLMQVTMLWTVSPDGILRIIPSLAIFLTGNAVPLPLLPDWMQGFLIIQPFRGLADTPFRIYSGDLIGRDAWGAMAWSVGWIVILWLIGSWMMRQGIKRLVVAGG
jgi:ABC-2 type transport system permease protein